MRKFLVRSFLAGLLLYILGGVSNELVIWLNGGFMPVQNYPGCDAFPGTIIDAMHSCASASNHLPWLVDRFDGLGVIFSVGDFLLFGGTVLLASAAFASVHELVNYIRG